MEIAIRKIERFNVRGFASSADSGAERIEARSLWNTHKEGLPPFLKSSSVLYGVTKPAGDGGSLYVFGVRIPDSPAFEAAIDTACVPLEAAFIPAGEYAVIKAPENTDLSEAWVLFIGEALPKKGYSYDKSRNTRFERYATGGGCELWLPAVPALSPRLTALSEIEGIDIGPALKRLAGKQSVLEMTALSVGSSIPERLSALELQLENGEIESFRNDIHGLKGSLAQIGAGSLSDNAAFLEAAAKEGEIDHCRDNFGRFAEGVKKLSNRLGEIFDY